MEQTNQLVIYSNAAAKPIRAKRPARGRCSGFMATMWLVSLLGTISVVSFFMVCLVGSVWVIGNSL